MSLSDRHQNMIEQIFNVVCDDVLSKLKEDEHLTISLNGERSQFIRFNNAKVRQIGVVADASIGLNLMFNNRSAYAVNTFTGDKEKDSITVINELNRLRDEVVQLPEDPYLVLPENRGSSREINTGKLLPENEAVDIILSAMQGKDIAGIYASGSIFKGSANSAGQRHWFGTETFSLDYSLITPDEKMVKGTYAGTEWDQSKYESKMALSKRQLEIMVKPVLKIKSGSYRTCFGPAAVADLIRMFSWQGVSEAAIQQGNSALIKMRNEGKALSPMFDLSEDFRDGTVPRFNDNGEMSVEFLPIISKGRLVNALVSKRTAKEYNKTSNYANDEETLRSPIMAGGELDEDNLLAELGTGLYLSNLHYLNWSDNIGGRITGMTRYACFWVENGEIIAPIGNMRFDDTIYNLFGDQLEGISENVEPNPEIETYEGRQFGGVSAPSILVKSFELTL